MFALPTIPAKIEACGVYAIRCPAGVYVGQSVKVYGRLRDHRKTLRARKHRSARLQDAYDTHGEAAFGAEILAERLDPHDKEILALVEQEFMDALGANLNVCPSSVSRAGAKMGARARANCSAGQRKRFERQEERDAHAARLRALYEENPELRAKLGDGRRGKTFGKHNQPMSEEGRANIAAAMKGKSRWGGKREITEEHREALRKAGEARRGRPSPKKGKPGKPCSEETRAKMRAAHRARLLSKTGV